MTAPRKWLDREPTQKMESAGWGELRINPDDETMADIWSAMWDAAPPLAQATDEQMTELERKFEAMLMRSDRGKLWHALAFYADPDTYFATSIAFDPPCGPFREDFGPVEDYDRHMPGKLARETLDALQAAPAAEPSGIALTIAASKGASAPTQTVTMGAAEPQLCPPGLLAAQAERHAAEPAKDTPDAELCARLEAANRDPETVISWRDLVEEAAAAIRALQKRIDEHKLLVITLDKDREQAERDLAAALAKEKP